MLKHRVYRNTTVGTDFGILKVNDQGIVDGLSPEQEDYFSKNFLNYELLDEHKEMLLKDDIKDETPLKDKDTKEVIKDVKEPKNDVKESPKVKAPAKPKAKTTKTTTKKTTKAKAKPKAKTTK